MDLLSALGTSTVPVLSLAYSKPLPSLPQADVIQKLMQVEDYLLEHVSSIPGTLGPPATTFRLMRSAGLAPTASLLDLMSAAWQPARILEFNPFLSKAACERLHEGVLVWLQLCVLEDRLNRVKKLVQAGNGAYTEPLTKVWPSSPQVVQKCLSRSQKVANNRQLGSTKTACRILTVALSWGCVELREKDLRRETMYCSVLDAKASSFVL